MTAAQNFMDHVKNKIYDAFVSQNRKLFDTVFEIEGKKLYADKLRLSVISTTFEFMLSDRWNSKNVAIEITNCSYENFKALLIYIYSGECNITDGNVMDMLDLTEFYHIDHLKIICDEYLSKKEINLGNVFQFLEISARYSLNEMKVVLQEFISANFKEFVKCEGFLNAGKAIVKELCRFEPAEQYFKAIYQWAEYQAHKKDPNDENFNKSYAIKAELTPFLPHIQFNKIGISFVKSYIAEKSFLFGEDEFNHILKNAFPEFKVKITNLSGQSISGILPITALDTIEIVKSLKDRPSDNVGDLLIFWNAKCKKPSTSSPIQPRGSYDDGIIWYLAYFCDGNIGLTNSYNIRRNEYLLTEMVPDDGSDYFQKSLKCKIDIEQIL